MTNSNTIFESRKMKLKSFINTTCNNKFNNSNNNKSNMSKTLEIPEINIIECEWLRMDYRDYIRFEYEMIKRARDAESTLNRILYNDSGDKQKSHSIASRYGTMSTLLSKLKKSSSHYLATSLPVIKVEDFETEEQDEEERDEEMLRVANEANEILTKLLSNNEDILTRRQSLTLHLSQNEPILPSLQKHNSKFQYFYGSFRKRKAKHLSVQCTSYSALKTRSHFDTPEVNLIGGKFA